MLDLSIIAHHVQDIINSILPESRYYSFAGSCSMWYTDKTTSAMPGGYCINLHRVVAGHNRYACVRVLPTKIRTVSCFPEHIPLVLAGRLADADCRYFYDLDLSDPECIDHCLNKLKTIIGIIDNYFSVD